MPRRPVLRRALAGVAATLVVLLVLAVAAVVTVVRRPLPDLGGEVDVPGLAAPVEVLRDERGVPQVYADTAEDLFFAQGFVHAQDRFFQMDYRRHVTAGRLSELVGPNDDAFAADAVVRTLGWRRVAEQELALLAPETRRYLQAYADGVNAYVEDRSPSELSLSYTLLSTAVDLPRIEPWEPVDSLAWLKAMAWDLRSNYSDELSRAVAFGAVQDVARVEQLHPGFPFDRHAPIATLPELEQAGAPSAAAVAGPARADAAAADAAAADAEHLASSAAQEVWAAAARALEAVPTSLGRGEGIGSNAWAVAGEHTESGAPLLANDPHLVPSQPSVWYQVGLHCRETGPSCPYDVSGFSFAGFPGVVIGQNAAFAWGFTNLAPDVTDFYLERVSGDGSYLRDGQLVPLDVRVETIEVAGEEPREVVVRSSVHGPLLSDRLDVLQQVGRSAPVGETSPARLSGYAVALSWTALTPGRTADAVFALGRAQDWTSFREALRTFEAPGQNVVYADAESIGYQATGRVPVRGPGDGTWPVPADGSWPLPGWSSAYDWQGEVPYDAMPTVLDPAEGIVVTANQAVVPPNFAYRLTTDWDAGYRSQRIRERLLGRIEDGDPLGVADMERVALDDRHGFAPVLVQQLLAVDLSASDVDPAFVEEARDLLRDWDGSTAEDSAAAAYYQAVWRRLLELAFGDELAVPAVAPTGGSRWFEVVRGLLASPRDAWWDDQRTPGVVETSNEVMRQALVDARLELTSDLGKDPERWQWGRLHRLELRQAPLGVEGAAPGPVQSLLNLGPVELGGSSGVVLATAWNASVGYGVTAVPSMRMVVDLDERDRSTWVDLSGVSGHPWSANHGDQLDAWAAGESFPWPVTRGAVEEAADERQVLRPAPSP